MTGGYFCDWMSYHRTCAERTRTSKIGFGGSNPATIAACTMLIMTLRCEIITAKGTNVSASCGVPPANVQPE